MISVPGEAITENSPLRTMFSLIQSHQQAIACEFADKYGEKYATSKFEKLAVDGKNYVATFSSFSLVIDESGYVAAERPAYASSNYQAIVQFSELENQNGFSFLKSAMSSSLISVISLPLTKICPLVTSSIVEIQFSSVVLPEPDAPMIAVNSPFSTSKDKSFTAFVILFFVP